MNAYGLEPVRFLGKDARIVRGVKQVLPIANPGAGNEWSYTVPGGEQWFVYGGRATFQASGNAANRTPTVAIEVDGFRCFQVADATVIIANGQVFYSIYGSDSPAPVASANTTGMFGLPTFPISQGGVIHSVTVNLDVADTWLNVRLYVARVYLPDQKLDEIAELEQRAYFDAMAQAHTRHGA